MSVEVLSVSPVRVKNRPTVRMRWALPEEVGLVFEVKAQQQAVEGYAPDRSSSEPSLCCLRCAWWASVPPGGPQRSNRDRGSATGLGWAGTPHDLCTHTQQVGSERKSTPTVGGSIGFIPGFGIQEAVDELHIQRVHAVVMVLLKKTWKLQDKRKVSGDILKNTQHIMEWKTTG